MRITSKRFRLYQDDNLSALKLLKDNSVDSVITDPPYGLGKEPDALEMLKQWCTVGVYTHKNTSGFMGNSWDAFVPQPILWKEILRVLKPGGHVLSFFGTRTYDIGVLSMRIAGFEVRDQISWVYGSGFPKSQNISKQIDKTLGKVQKVVGKRVHPTLKDLSKVERQESTQFHGKNKIKDSWDITEENSDAAKKWKGWGTAIKPSHENIVICRKPLAESTVAKNIMKHNTGGLNIDASRVPLNKDKKQATAGTRVSENGEGWGVGKSGSSYIKGTGAAYSTEGRFPANFIHDGSDEVLHLFPVSNSSRQNNNNDPKRGGNSTPLFGASDGKETIDHRDSGSAARFFYCAKVSRSERNYGLSEFKTSTDQIVFKKGRANCLAKCPEHNESLPSGSTKYKCGCDYQFSKDQIGRRTPNKNIHPTVKPIALMSYLCKLVTPEKGVVLDPFMGSGSTGVAAVRNGFRFIGMESNLEFFDIAVARISLAEKEIFKD